MGQDRRAPLSQPEAASDSSSSTQEAGLAGLGRRACRVWVARLQFLGQAGCRWSVWPSDAKTPPCLARQSFGIELARAGGLQGRSHHLSTWELGHR